MALFSILLGVAFFFVAIAWFGFIALYSQTENSGFAFGFILGVLPTALGMLLIIPSTLYRSFFVITKKPEQSFKDKVILIVGLLITLLYCGALFKLGFT